ncbi:PP2C family protein-serine/threonine phosphatase [Kitasatospora sp. NPDC007106]|uniref:PP2C family protein-serine/threonine phosphatase n=1 Tax=Kitasatospora sp. NPDC007106 TaxID=3156914 RepID=UPI00340A0101
MPSEEKAVAAVDEAGVGRVVGEFLEMSHDVGPRDIAGLVDDTARALGMAGAAVYLADVQQVRLVPLPDDRPRGPGTDETGVPVEGTLAGWAYRTMKPQESSADGRVELWLPLVDGVERIGVLRVAAAAPGPAVHERCRTLASLTALVVISKAAFSDVMAEAVRSRPMTLQAELAWAFMPPRTLGTRDVTSSAALEPAYEIGGDAFDHSLQRDRLHLTVVDAMGHDLAAGGASAVAVAGCRSTRRAGGGLADIAEAVDGALTRWIPDRLLTAVFADLDTGTGRLSWVNFGHPPPLLIRRQHVVPGALERPAQLPLGLGSGYPRGPATVHHAQLEPGDRILVHTDGVTEARSAAGDLFGEERLVDLVVRSAAAGEPAPEALRRLILALLEHRDHRLVDDATIVLVEWHPRG